MKLKNKALAFILSAVMMVSFMPTFAFAVETEEADAVAEAPAVTEEVVTDVTEENATDEAAQEEAAPAQAEAPKAQAPKIKTQSEKAAKTMANPVSLAIEDCDKIGEYDGDSVYYAMVPDGTDTIEFSDFAAEDVAMICRYDMSSDDMVTEDNACPIYSSFSASKDDVDEFLDDGLAAGDDHNYNNTYGFLVLNNDYDFCFFFINVGNAQEVPVTFESKYGTGKLLDTRWHYEAWVEQDGTWVPVAEECPLYELNVPKADASVDLTLSDKCLVYNYAGENEWISPWYDDETSAAGMDKATVKVDENNDGKADYIQVQKPYGNGSNGELLFAIKLNPVDFTSNFGSGKLLDTKWNYEAWIEQGGTWVPVAGEHPLYKLNVPAGTETIDLSFPAKCLVYNYAGENEWIGPWYGDEESQTGMSAVTVNVDENKDGKADYIQVQNPYKAGNQGGEVLFAIQISYLKNMKSATLSKTAYTYDGKVKAPAVTVKDADGTVLKKNTDYKVSYATGRKNVGTYKVTVTGIGDYTGTKTLSFKINPKGTSLTKVSALGGKKFKATWKLQKTQTTGYQIKYSKKSSMTNAVYSKKIKGQISSKKMYKVSKGKKYVKVRTYKVVNGKTYYSAWSAAKTVYVK